MKVPYNWLKEYVEIDITAKELADRLTMSGSKVEYIEEQGKDIKNVVVGKVLSMEKHENADKLRVAKVEVGSEIVQIVTGAQNVQVSDVIPVALDGALLPDGKKITKGKLRGVESFGMMCSINELGLTKNDYPEAAEDGIFILDNALKIGMDIKEALGINDTIIEFEITPNRPDCLSVYGMARETAVTLDKELNKIDFNTTAKISENPGFSVEIHEPSLCNRYIGRIIHNVKIAPSPEWMKKKLRASGIRPINNVVDVTNYILLELGQPMHAFDFDKLEGKKINVRIAKQDEIMDTLDGQQRKLNADMLVIADERKPVAVAGVMGGAYSEITDATTTLLFESANFCGKSIRQTAKALGMRTESSARFEKGLDPENAYCAINRAVELLEKMGAGKADEYYVDNYPVKPEANKIEIRPDRINGLLGTNLTADYMISIFEKLEMKVDKEAMTALVPSFRNDIEGIADLAEEVARFYGYNNINSRLFTGETSIGKKTHNQTIEDICKDVLVAQGLNEIFTYSFVSPKSFDSVLIPQDSNLRNVVEISNPISEEHKIMRTTTIPSMMEALEKNFTMRNNEAMLFEIARIYLPRDTKNDELPDEKQKITIGLYGNVDFYSMKGLVEELVDACGIMNYSFERENNCSLHPGRTAKLMINNVEAGILGEVHPDVMQNYGIDTKCYIAVIDFQTIAENANLLPKYKQLPKFPAMERDIAMVVSDEVLAGDIENAIKKKAGKNLEEVKLFDVYKGSQIGNDKKSMAYSLRFRAEDRTLTDEEINKVMNNILENLKNEIGAELRS